MHCANCLLFGVVCLGDVLNDVFHVHRKEDSQILQGTIRWKPNVRVLPWYFLCSLGILGDLTHKYPLYEPFFGDFP